MELIVIIPAALLVGSVALILQKTANMLEQQQEIEQAEAEHRKSGWLLVIAALACAALLML
jgi:hypothetical protein